MSPYALLLLTLLYTCLSGCVAQEGCTQKRDGCKIEDSRCICGYGCISDYRFTTQSECQKTLKGSSSSDICQSSPCRNKGTCIQVSMYPGFKCRCEGTGFYGLRCHKACPKLTARTTSEYPFECIVI